ncbi:Arc family DNA-binding protein [Psychrobacter pacificensis]|uniref:Arc family DNA-binding protein n=1 Tax=Psychrobacter pacificensis TaxID=112002 RepID=UPI001BB0A3F4
MTKNVQFNLRIPTELKERIAVASQASGRSINAEAQYRLEKSFNSQNGSYKEAIVELREFFDSHLRKNRLEEISQKLNFLLEEARAVTGTDSPSISRVAEALGYKTVGLTEDWFEGRKEPDFEVLTKIAKYFGAQEKWLIHNEGKPFEKIDFEFSRDIERNAEQLLSGCTDGSEAQAIWFVRNQSKNGELIIVKHFNSWHGQVLDTRVHVSNTVGFGGAEDRALMSLTLKYLCRKHLLKTYGTIVSEADYDRLLWEKENPIKVIQNFRRSTWIEDIWDKSMYMKEENSYWEGWIDMCRSNATFIEHDDYSPKLSDISSNISNSI